MILVKYGIFFSSLFLLHHGPYGGMGNGNLALVGEWNRRVYFFVRFAFSFVFLRELLNTMGVRPRAGQ